MFAVRDEQAALDIVQDAMLKLTEKYAQKPPGELPMLFQRILPNTDSNATEDPAAQLEQAQVVGLIEDAIARLPARQREAFLLRYWEELDVAETAAAMGCSEGSVKTHCSRAVAALASMLKAKGIAP